MSRRDIRHFTCLLLQKVEDGELDPTLVIQSFCSFLSEDDVYKMMRSNELLWPHEDKD